MLQRRIAALENHLKQVPEDARARILMAGDYADMGREEDALREVARPLRCARISFDSLQRGVHLLRAQSKSRGSGYSAASVGSWIQGCELGASRSGPCGFARRGGI